MTTAQTLTELVEVVNLPGFDLNGERHEIGAVLPLEDLLAEWGGNVVHCYLQTGRLRRTHPDAAVYPNGQMPGEAARQLVSGGAQAFGPGVGYRPDPAKAPPAFEAADWQAELLSAAEDFTEGDAEGDETFDPYTRTASEVQAWVTAHPGTARAVLSMELTGKERKGLVAWLQAEADVEPDDPEAEEDDDNEPPAPLSHDPDLGDDFVIADDV